VLAHQNDLETMEWLEKEQKLQFPRNMRLLQGTMKLKTFQFLEDKKVEIKVKEAYAPKEIKEYLAKKKTSTNQNKK
jgi:hypothetical protein